jgi:hypothetical protein
MTKAELENLAERAGWTLAQAAVAFGITEAAGLKTWWALPLATALSAAKTFTQGKLDARKKPSLPTAD